MRVAAIGNCSSLFACNSVNELQLSVCVEGESRVRTTREGWICQGIEVRCGGEDNGYAAER